MDVFYRPLDQVLPRLQAVKRSGADWQARCPAHADQTPSLSIQEAADGTVLLKCFAGCRPEAIVATLGLTLKDLFPAGLKTAATGGPHLGSPVAVYSYVDESGELLFQTLRYEWTEHDQRKKTFKQRRPDGQGGWIYNLRSTRLVLYRLPQLIAAQRAHQTIFIVEGEKDAEALAALGLVATTNPLGAGKWRASYSEGLRGADVVLLPDQDGPGWHHMDAVARSLYGLAQRIRIVELADLPPKGDVSDWLARGGTRAALEQLVAETPAYTPAAEKEDAGDHAYRPFPVAVLPEPVRSFIDQGAETIGCDVSFVALPLLAALAAAIGNTRCIALKRNWTEPAVLWTVVVSDSGALKSPALDLATRWVKRQQRAALERYEAARRAHQDRVLEYEAALAEWKKSGHKAGHTPPARPDEPVAERYYCSDTTIEALAGLLPQAPRGLLVIRDELAGWLQGFNQYKKSGGDEAHWLEMHRAGALLVDRKTGPQKVVYVPRAAASVTGTIQPAILQAALGRTYFENGLAARLLFSMPPRQLKQWRDTDLDPVLEERMAAVFDRLRRWTFQAMPDGTLEPVRLPLTDGARAAWVAFYNAHAQEQAEILDHDLTAAWSKLEGYAARLALVVHGIRWAADDPTLASPAEVDEVSIAAGVELSQWFGQEARRVYSVLAETSAERAQRHLLDLIQRKGGRITVRELMRSNRQFKNAVQAEEQLQPLVERGLVRMERVGTSGQGGRPFTAFVLAAPVDDATPGPHPSPNPASGARDPESAFEQTTENSFLETASAIRIQEQVRTWSDERRMAWEERAAIIEYDGNLSRTEAERLAWEQIVKEFSEDPEREGDDSPGLS